MSTGVFSPLGSLALGGMSLLARVFGYWFDYLTYKIPPPPAMHATLSPSTHEIPPAAVPSTRTSMPAALIVVPSAVLSVTLFLVLAWRF